MNALEHWDKPVRTGVFGVFAIYVRRKMVLEELLPAYLQKPFAVYVHFATKIKRPNVPDFAGLFLEEAMLAPKSLSHQEFSWLALALLNGFGLKVVWDTHAREILQIRPAVHESFRYLLDFGQQMRFYNTHEAIEPPRVLQWVRFRHYELRFGLDGAILHHPFAHPISTLPRLNRHYQTIYNACLHLNARRSLQAAVCPMSQRIHALKAGRHLLGESHWYHSVPPHRRFPADRKIMESN